jgi:hypothetical protein
MRVIAYSTDCCTHNSSAASFARIKTNKTYRMQMEQGRMRKPSVQDRCSRVRRCLTGHLVGATMYLHLSQDLSAGFLLHICSGHPHFILCFACVASHSCDQPIHVCSAPPLRSSSMKKLSVTALATEQEGVAVKVACRCEASRFSYRWKLECFLLKLSRALATRFEGVWSNFRYSAPRLRQRNCCMTRSIVCSMVRQ